MSNGPAQNTLFGHIPGISDREVRLLTSESNLEEQADSLVQNDDIACWSFATFCHTELLK